MRSDVAADRARVLLESGVPLALLGLALLSASGPAAAQSPPLQSQPQVPYTVQKGDECRDIARRYWPDDPKALDRLHEMNPQLGPLPHHLKPGAVLQVMPIVPDAQLTFLKPDVKRRAEREPDWKQAVRGDGLFRLDQVNTLRGAGAEITFHDLSAVQLDENALIVIYGDAARPRKAEKSGALELLQGDAAVSLSSLRGEKPLEVKTPAARVALRGEKSRVGVDRAQMSRVEVYRGDARVAAQGREVAVKSGFGTRVEKGKTPEEPTPLPEAPAWADAGQTLFSAFADEVPLQLSFAPVLGGVLYRVQIARDAAFNDRVFDRTLRETGVALQLAPGAYQARVWAIDGKGLDGQPSLSRVLQLVAVRVQGGARDGAGTIQGKAGTPLEVELEGPPELAVSLDGAAPETLAQRRRWTLEQPGAHALQAQPLALSFFIEPPPPPPAPAPPPAEAPAQPVVPVVPAPPHTIPVVGETRGPLGSTDAITGGTALPTAFVERGFSAQLRLQDEFSAPANRNRVLLSALDLEAGNGAAAVFATGTLQGNPGAGSTLGFPTVGLRGRVLGNDARTLSLGGDVSIDISNAAGALDLTRARVWLAGGLRLGALSLSTTQAIFTASPGSGYEGSLVSGYLLCPGFLIQAELDADVGGPCASGTCAGGAAALGVRSRWRILELGASLRSGLWTDGRTLWGKPGALVTLGLRFGGRDWIVSP